MHALEVASTARQALAALVDGVGTFVVVGLVLRGALAVLDLRPTLQALTDVVHGAPMRLVPVIVACALALLSWQAVAVVLGASPGQRLAGLHLVDAKGAPPSRARLAVRAAVASVGVAAFLAGPAFALFLDRLRRGPGDVVAGTVAVRR